MYTKQTLGILIWLTAFSHCHFDRSYEQVKSQLNFVIQMNELAYTIAYEHDQFNSFIGVRALALSHLAIHDLWNHQSPSYEIYLPCNIQKDYNLTTAAAQSTQEILTSIYPNRKDTIISVTNKWIDQADLASQSIGQHIAKTYLEHRKNDGHHAQGTYNPMTKPGDYQYTPGYDWVWKPDFSVAQPFVLERVDQFRSPPPPEQNSESYLKSYEEVKKFGSKNSTTRSPDQTAIAHWWAEFGENSWNRIGRIIAKKQAFTPKELNRMFALINMSLYDLYLASFDSKYYYDTWRPYTAIRAGHSDLNKRTIGDPEWEPEMQTPPWPEYPSAHAAVGALGATIVKSIIGSNKVSFAMRSTTALDGSEDRSYSDLDKAVQHCADSRIYNGFHFRFATEEGIRQGIVIANYILSSRLQPIQ